MTSLVIEHFHTPDSLRRARRLESVRRRATERLVGRSVWCAAVAPTETVAADALERCLHSVDDQGVAPHRTVLQLREPVIGLMERLDAMLRGIRSPGPVLGPGEEEAYMRGMQDGDALIPVAVQPGDVVVLHDPIAAALGQAIRERGAHAIWRASIGRGGSNAAAAWRFLHRPRPALAAYILAWRGRGGIAAYISAPGGIAAYSSAPGMASAKELDPNPARQGYEEVGWTTLLADVVRDDRAERVGGVIDARPSVAAR